MTDEINERLYRRLQHVVKTGMITAVPVETGGVQTMQVSSLQGYELHDGIPVVQHFGIQSSPPVNSSAVMISCAGDQANKIVIGTHSPTARVKTLQSGDTRLFDNSNQQVFLSGGESAIIQANGNIKFIVNGVTVMTMTGSQITIDVPVVSSQDITASNTVSLTHHVNTLVQSGSSNSGPPQR